MNKARSGWVLATYLCPQLRGKIQLQTTAAAGRRCATGLCTRSNVWSWTPCLAALTLSRLTRALSFSSKMQWCRGCSSSRFCVMVARKRSEARSGCTQPAWLCPGLCGKLQLQTAVVGRHCTAGLHPPSHFMGSTPCFAAPAPQHPSRKSRHTLGFIRVTQSEFRVHGLAIGYVQFCRRSGVLP